MAAPRSKSRKRRRSSMAVGTTVTTKESHRARLLSNAERCGLKLRSDVQGDGKCYFRALADQLARIGLLESVKTTSHEALRAEICDYMQYNAIPEMEHHVSAEYISNMRQNHEWAGEPEIVATMKKYGVNMKVVTSAAGSTTNGFYMHHFQEKNATETLYLGHIHENHYVSLEPDDNQEQYPTKDIGAPSPAMSSADSRETFARPTKRIEKQSTIHSFFGRSTPKRLASQEPKTLESKSTLADTPPRPLTVTPSTSPTPATATKSAHSSPNTESTESAPLPPSTP
ncbi:uncharacterized protein [Apostichopus japonicus]